eukprot:EG_transcript_21949
MCKIVPCVKLLITSVQRRDVRYPATPLKTLARRLIKPAESHCPGNDECEETTNVFFGVGQQLARCGEPRWSLGTCSPAGRWAGRMGPTGEEGQRRAAWPMDHTGHPKQRSPYNQRHFKKVGARTGFATANSVKQQHRMGQGEAAKAREVGCAGTAASGGWAVVEDG